jgi:hypothetical protein
MQQSMSLHIVLCRDSDFSLKKSGRAASRSREFCRFGGVRLTAQTDVDCSRSSSALAAAYQLRRSTARHRILPECAECI